MAKKSLNLSSLKKLDSQYNTVKEITLSNDYTIQIDLKFRLSRIEEVFEKLSQIHKIIQEDELLKDSFNFERYSFLLLILNFTSLRNMELTNLSDELHVAQMLVDQGLFKEIIEKIEQEVPEEIKKFNTSIFSIMQERINSLKQQQEFYDILNDEIDKQKLESEKDVSEDIVESVEQEGDENLESPATVEADRSEVKE